MTEMREAEVAVIGAGVVGICSALALQADGHRVTMLDRNAPGSGCSRGNAGEIMPGGVVPVATPGIIAELPKMLMDPLSPLALRWSYLPRMLPWLLEFMRSASPRRVERIAGALASILQLTLEDWQRLMDDTGTIDMLRRQGVVYAYEDEATWRENLGDYEMRRRHGITVETLSADELRQMVPALSRAHQFAAFIPNAAHVTNPLRLSERLAAVFEARGGTILRSNVSGLRFESGDKPRVMHASGDLAADKVVIAAGAFSKHLAAAAGAKVLLDTQRGYHAMLPTPGIELSMPMVSGDRKFAITPMEHGIRLAGTVELAGLDAAPNYDRARVLMKHAERILPGLRTENAELWMGFRPALPDSLPVIGTAPRASVVLAFGHGHLGLTMAAATGKLVADLVAGRKPPIDLAPFRAGRW